MLQKLQTWLRIDKSWKNPNNNIGKICLTHERERNNHKGDRREEATKGRKERTEGGKESTKEKEGYCSKKGGEDRDVWQARETCETRERKSEQWEGVINERGRRRERRRHFSPVHPLWRNRRRGWERKDSQNKIYTTDTKTENMRWKKTKIPS